MKGRAGLVTVLAATMAASTFMLQVFGVLAADLLVEFDVERWQVGALVTAASAVAALTSPRIGALVDGAGASRSMLLAIGGAAAALAAIALSPTYWVLVAAAVLSGGPQAIANPATNKLLAERFAAGARGVATGIKQSGVQVGILLAGLFLPLLAAASDWRGAVLVFAALWAAWAVVARRVLPTDPPPRSRADEARGTDGVPLPPLVGRLTLYGFLLGAGGSTIFTYLPLYAEEALGTTGAVAGAAVAVTGGVGVAARIAWGRLAEHRVGSVRSLRIIAGLAVLAPALLLLAPATPSLLWPAAVVTGLSASSWNAVGNLAIIQGLPRHSVGRASGRMMFGFLTGLGLGAPALGWSVDLTGSYAFGWSGAAVTFVLALLGLVGAHETDPGDLTSTGTAPRDGDRPRTDEPVAP